MQHTIIHYLEYCMYLILLNLLYSLCRGSFLSIFRILLILQFNANHFLMPLSQHQKNLTSKCLYREICAVMILSSTLVIFFMYQLNTFLLACQLSCILDLHQVRPFLINTLINSTTFYLMLEAEYGCVHLVFYVRYLLLYIIPTPSSLPVLLPLDNKAYSEYMVKDILDSRLRT